MAHSHKSHFFHLIWSTKNRTKWIEPKMQSDLYAYMGGVVRNHKGSLLEIGGMQDHVHLLISLRNLDKYSYMIRDVKAHSTHWVRKNYLPLREFGWQDGCGSFTFNYSLLDDVKNYIQNQEKHHKIMTFEEEYLLFLNKQNIPFDPRFAFD